MQNKISIPKQTDKLNFPQSSGSELSQNNSNFPQSKKNATDSLASGGHPTGPEDSQN